MRTDLSALQAGCPLTLPAGCAFWAAMSEEGDCVLILRALSGGATEVPTVADVDLMSTGFSPKG